MKDDEIAAFETLLADLSGAARTQPLLGLGKLHAIRYRQAGPGTAAALLHLEECIRALDEAYGCLSPDDALRGQTAALLGLQLGMKFGAHGGAAADRERAVRLLDEALASSAGAEPSYETRTLLTMADVMRTFLGSLGGGIGGLDPGRLMQALGKLQDLQQNGLGGFLPGAGMPNAAGPAAAEDIAPQEPASAPAPVSVDVDLLRKELRTLLAGHRAQENIDEHGYEFRVVVALLRSEEAPPWIDDFVELATSVVYSADPATGTDHFLLAAALYLRGLRDDDGGWLEPGEGQGGGAAGVAADIVHTDAQAAVSSLLIAAETLPADRPDAIPALLFLATLLPAEALIGVAEQLTDVAAAVRACGAEALVFPDPVRSLRLNAPTGRIETVGPTDPDKPADEAADVVGTAVGTGKTILVVGEDPPAADDDLAVSYIASLTQLMDLSRRKTRPITEEPVFVVNPRGDRENATMEAMLLRRTFYPRSTGLGRLVENSDGAGTASEVRAHLDASLLHLACGITAAGALELVDSAELHLSGLSIPHGGLVILPPGHFLPWADTFLEAGFTGVIGWRRPVPEHIAALMLFVLHTELVDNGRSPAAAVRAVRQWIRHPDHSILPRLLAGSAEHLGESRESDWASLVHRGR
jgi:hypothetical protein